MAVRLPGRHSRWVPQGRTVGEMLLLFAILALALVTLPPLVGQMTGEQLARYTIPATAAAIVVLGFLVRPAAGLLAFALFVMVRETTQIWLGSPIRQIDEIAIPALFAVAFVRYRPDRHAMLSPVREGAVALIVAAALASSLLNAVPFHLWALGLVLLLKGIAFFYVALWSTYSEAELRGAIVVVAAVAVLAALVALVELLAPSLLSGIGLERTFSARSGLPSLRSLFFHPLMFGWFCAFVALFAHAHYVVYRRPWMLLVGLLMSVGVFLSGRRRVMLALGTALVAGFGWHMRHIRLPAAVRTWAPTGVGTLVLVVAFMPALTSLYQMTTEQLAPGLGPLPAPTREPVVPGVTPAPLVPGRDPGDDAFTVREGDVARVALYRASVSIARDYFPLGAGLGRYGSWMSRVEYSPIYREYGLDQIHGLRPHNPVFATDTFWPQVLGEMGVFGLVGYVVFLAWILLALWRSIDRTVTPLTRALCIGALLIFVQALVESAAAPMFHSPPRIYMTFLAVGAALALVRLRSGASEQAQTPSAALP